MSMKRRVKVATDQVSSHLLSKCKIAKVVEYEDTYIRRRVKDENK